MSERSRCARDGLCSVEAQRGAGRNEGNTRPLAMHDGVEGDGEVYDDAGRRSGGPKSGEDRGREEKGKEKKKETAIPLTRMRQEREGATRRDHE